MLIGHDAIIIISITDADEDFAEVVHFAALHCADDEIITSDGGKSYTIYLRPHLFNELSKKIGLMDEDGNSLQYSQYIVPCAVQELVKTAWDSVKDAYMCNSMDIADNLATGCVIVRLAAQSLGLVTEEEVKAMYKST